MLAEDYEGATLPVDNEPRIRMLIAGGSLVRFIVIYAILAPDGSVDIVELELDR